MPADTTLDIPAVYSVKVLDARHDSPPEFSGGESDSDSDADSEVAGPNEAEEMAEGWFWSPAKHLAELWFCDYQTPWEELVHLDDSWDATPRFVSSMFAVKHNLPLSERRRELFALKAS